MNTSIGFDCKENNNDAGCDFTLSFLHFTPQGYIKPLLLAGHCEIVRSEEPYFFNNNSQYVNKSEDEQETC